MYITRTGQILLNPSEKAAKYALEIKTKKAFTNDGYAKKDETGKQKGLTRDQLIYRAGYLDHQKDSNRAFKSKNKKYKRKTK